MPSARQRIRQAILKKRGLETAGHGKLRPETIHLPQDKHKTLAMKLIESKLGLPMEVLLLQGRGDDIAKRLGVSEACVSRWRRRLGLR